MFSLSDLLGEQQGNDTLGQISSAIGADQGATSSAIQMALPMIVSGLANNASTPDGAQSLNNALEQDHSGGGLLGNIGGLIMGQLQPSRETDGGGILGHILGTKKDQAAETISGHSGLNTGQVMQVLMMLAPIVMGFLGKKKQEENLDSGGLAGYLGGQQQQMQSADSGIMGMVSGFLDSDKDGSALDDVASMAFNYFNKK
jgi:hypothetical protein